MVAPLITASTTHNVGMEIVWLAGQILQYLLVQCREKSHFKNSMVPATLRSPHHMDGTAPRKYHRLLHKVACREAGCLGPVVLPVQAQEMWGLGEGVLALGSIAALFEKPLS